MIAFRDFYYQEPVMDFYKFGADYLRPAYLDVFPGTLLTLLCTLLWIQHYPGYSIQGVNLSDLVHAKVEH